MAKVELKQPIVDEIKASLEGAQGVVVVDYRGLTVEQDTQLRKQMREEGIVYKVYKNTMLNFAIKGTEFEPLSQHLEGPSAIAISKTDATAPARIVANFAKKAEKLEIKAGVVEGNYYDAKGMTAIANVPSREVLLGKLLGSIQHFGIDHVTADNNCIHIFDSLQQFSLLAIFFQQDQFITCTFHYFADTFHSYRCERFICCH